MALLCTMEERVERLLALSDVAEATSTSVAFWRKLVARKQIRTVHIGRAVRVPESELLRFIASGEVSRRSPNRDA